MIVLSSEQQVTGNQQPLVNSEQTSNLQPNTQENSENGKWSEVAVRFNAERLKLLDEFSRIILELKNSFPSLAQILTKARDNISVNQDNISVKTLTNLLNTLQQSVNSFKETGLPAGKLQLAETIKNIINEIAKILQPNSEVQQEYKLIQALSKNDFASANIAIKNIVETFLKENQNLPNTMQNVQNPQDIQTIKNTTQNTQTQALSATSYKPIIPLHYLTIFNALQELKTMGLPQELQNAPLKELEEITLLKTGIEIPQNIANKISATINEKPVFVNINELPLPKDIDIRKQIQNQNVAISFHQIIKNQTVNLTPNISLQNSETALSLHQIINIKNHDVQNADVANKQNVNVNNIQSSASQFILQTWHSATYIPKEERSFWAQTNLPLTPQLLNIRDLILSFSKTDVNADFSKNIEAVKLFANNMHELSLKTEQGASVSKQQANLLWNIINHPKFAGSEFSDKSFTQLSALHSSLLKYQPEGNYEGELFKKLPEQIKRELLQELPNGKLLQSEMLQKAIEKVELLGKANEEVRHILQNLKEQVQWTRIDQDTRPPQDKENVFYFMHNNELQKGRLKIRDERKGANKKKQDSTIKFSIETKTKKLGNVRADLTLNKNTLSIRIQDELGTADQIVKEEKEILSKELIDIGISLGELLYGKTPKIQTLTITEKVGKNSGLDVRA